MSNRRSVALVDSNFRRRAAISHQLASNDFHVEPFEDLKEIQRTWPSSGTVMVEDRDGSIRDAVLAMTDDCSWLPLIAFSEVNDTTAVVRAILEGAIDYFHWPSSSEQLIEMIGVAETSGASIGSVKLREARARSRVQRLTRREREVLVGVADGLSNRLIGEQLMISPRTVEIHRANMLMKMGASHTSEAIRIAVEAALVA
jgi:two-component system response regulator FixJ